MKVLSLFDGIAGARQALKELEFNFEYYASEIDNYAIKIAQQNHNIFPLGDVKSLFGNMFGKTITYRRLVK